METKGLLVNVFRNANGYDCTANGISLKNNSLILIGDGVNCQVFEGNENNTVKLLKKNVGGNDYIYAVPLLERPENSVGPMFGGNFIYCSDSRFPSKQPIPIHDRFEVQR
jgi:hypothetical protein